MTPLLPKPDENGRYRYPDGSAIWPAESPRGKWMACWADGSLLLEDNGNVSYFTTLEDAALALKACGEGPASQEQKGPAMTPLANGMSPAFPATGNVALHGLSKREWLAGLAMQGLLSDGCWGTATATSEHAEKIADEAVTYADALLERLEKS